MRSIDAVLIADLHEVLEGWSDRMAFGIGCDRAIYVVAQRPSSKPFHQDTLIVRIDDNGARSLTIPELGTSVSFVQPIGDDILLVASRWKKADASRANAMVVDWEGHEIQRFMLGDGIEDVRVSADREIWVTYFDEGVYGSGESPLGAPGLVRFDTQGEVRFTYDAGAAGTDFIHDAYAFNLTERGTAWICFYSEFPIVSIRNDVYRTWKCGVAGAHAIAVRSERVLLSGTYQERDVGHLLVLDGDEARVLEAVRFRDTDGGSLATAHAYGWGDRLYFVKDKRVLVVSDW